jgi:hypothetical protein
LDLERRRTLLWERESLDEMRKKQAGVYLYTGVHLTAGVKILSLKALYKGICEWI